MEEIVLVFKDTYRNNMWSLRGRIDDQQGKGKKKKGERADHRRLLSVESPLGVAEGRERWAGNGLDG